MQQNTFTCSKCHNNYPIQSKVMHELYCRGSSNVPQHQIPLQQPLYHPQPQIDINAHIPYQPQYIPQAQKCPKCGIKLPQNEMSDHLLVHQLDKENNIPENAPQEQNEASSNSSEPDYDDEDDNNYGYQMNNNNNMNYNIQPHSQPPAHRTHQMTTAQNGYSTEKIEEISGNMKTVKIIIRDPNGNIVSQQMSTQSIGGGGNNNVNMLMNSNGMPMQMNLPTGFRLNFGSSPLNLSNIAFNDVHSSFLYNPYMINNQNNVEAFLEQINQPSQHPVPDTIVNELPEITIDSVDKLDGDKKDCTICLNSFKHGDKALILPCIHIFHTDCIKNWFKTQNTCPICKVKINANSLNN